MIANTFNCNICRCQLHGNHNYSDMPPEDAICLQRGRPCGFGLFFAPERCAGTIHICYKCADRLKVLLSVDETNRNEYVDTPLGGGK